jgi:tyrosyl-tRNA synthetase
MTPDPTTPPDRGQAKTQGQGQAQSPALVIPDSIREEWEILTSGTVECLPAEELRDKLVEAKKTGRPLRIKLGADPSAPDLHLGHTVQLNKLRQFQRLGHQVVFIVGDFTASIGDPTGRNEARPALSCEAIAQNAKTYLDQIFKILDPAKTEVVRNSDWLAPMRFADVVRLASQHTVARMLERDDFSKRYADGRPIFIHEFLYPLVQGYDSVVVRADVEIGGTDQKFNLLVGRELMREAGMAPQCIMTLPLLVGLDGVDKMSKSKGNYIGIGEAPGEIFGKAMSAPDSQMRDYLALTLGYREAEADRMLREVEAGALHPRDLKARIAAELVERYHGAAAAAEAREGFDRLFRQKEIPDAIEEATLALGEDGTLGVLAMLTQAGLTSSNGEARRLIAGGGVKLDGEKLDDALVALDAGEYLVQVGKRRFKRIRLT